ncbi:hypothetical protein B7R22_08920 [Subtercola boreus]|uniref:Uncharacterized protein n=1 Tax=Subtercola boreus TaxID=120213 RepID=A0A3E0VZW8_9MICO|nr:hypothetical protein B7R22_08920 [Subtercola boreus]
MPVTVPVVGEGGIPVDEAYDWGSERAGALAGVQADVDAVARDDAEADRLRARMRSGLAGVVAWVRQRGGSVGAWAGARERGRRVRLRTLVVATTVCVLAVVGALVTLPGGGSGGHETGSSSAPISAAPISAAPISAAPASAAPSTVVRPGKDTAAPAAGAAGEARGPEVAASISAAESAAVVAADPVAAATALLDLRARCLAARSEPCLQGAEQALSSVLQADAASVADARAAVPTGVDGNVAPGVGGIVPPGVLRLVQTVGASALVEVVHDDPQREPASLLLVKGEAGWRLRELFGDWP